MFTTCFFVFPLFLDENACENQNVDDLIVVANPPPAEICQQIPGRCVQEVRVAVPEGARWCEATARLHLPYFAEIFQEQQHLGWSFSWVDHPRYSWGSHINGIPMTHHFPKFLHGELRHVQLLVGSTCLTYFSWWNQWSAPLKFHKTHIKSI